MNTLTERVQALIKEPLDSWSVHLCEGIEQMSEDSAKLFAQRGSFAEGTLASVYAARLRLQDLDPDKYGSLEVTGW